MPDREPRQGSREVFTAGAETLTVSQSTGQVFDISPSSQFGINVALGKISGYDENFVLGLNRDVGATLEDVWGAGSDLVYPVAGEQWEVVSDNVNDNIAGTGARVAILFALDDNYDPVSEQIIMNGTTPVETVATNLFRPDTLLLVSSGSAGNNVGSITVRVQGDGNPRNFMHPGFGLSFDGHHTVPRGMTSLMQFCQVNAGRADGVEFRLFVRIGAVGNFVVLQYNNLFENSINTVFPVPISIGEFADIKMMALNSGGGADADCFVACGFITIDNDVL